MSKFFRDLERQRKFDSNKSEREQRKREKSEQELRKKENQTRLKYTDMVTAVLNDLASVVGGKVSSSSDGWTLWGGGQGLLISVKPDESCFVVTLTCPDPGSDAGGDQEINQESWSTSRSSLVNCIKKLNKKYHI